MKVQKILKAATVGCVLMAAFTSCYQFFETKVDMEIGKKHGSIGDLLFKEVSVSSLAVPEQVYVSQNSYSDRIFIKWNDVDNATSYRLEKAIVAEKDGGFPLPDESDFVLVKEAVFANEYYDVIVEDPKYSSEEYKYKYFYRIMAQDIGEGLESNFSFPPDHVKVYKYVTVTDPETNEAYETVKLDDEGNPVIDDEATKAKQAAYNAQYWGSLFSAPVRIDADKGKSQTSINITWSAVDGAVYYKIFRGQNENGSSMELLDTVRGNTLKYENLVSSREQGVEYYYKVCAQNSFGSDSVTSGLAMGYSLKEGAPVAPDGITTSSLGDSTTEFKLSWQPVSAAVGKTVLYSVYRNSSEDSIYSVVKTNMTETAITDKNKLKPGVYYYYYVQTIIRDDSTGEVLKSSFSDTGTYAYILSAPSEIDIEDGSDSGKKFIVWKPAINNLSGAKNVYKYNIKSSANANGPFTTFETIEESDPCYNSATGVFRKEVDTKDFYVISTVCEAFGLESADSSVFAPIPDSPNDVFASKCSRAGMSDAEFVHNANEVYPVKITWKKPSTGNAPAGYSIYRSTKPDAAFRKIGEISGSSATNSYIDVNETAKSSVFYYYKVISLNELGQGKKSNDPADDPMHKARGYGAITREQWFREYNKNIASSQAKLTLMHKPNDLDKVGSESKEGTISGTVGYNAKVAGLGAEIAMPYKNYADWFIGDEPLNGIKFVLNGNTDTTSNMSANGHMHEKMNCYSYSIDLTGDVGNAFEKLKESTKEKILATHDKNYLVGMYPGYAIYDNLEIKGGAAGGGYYLVKIYETEGGTKNSYGNEIIEPTRPNSNVDMVDWLVGEEMHK